MNGHRSAGRHLRPVRPDRHGNRHAIEGCSLCECGCKYWEDDRCVDCGARFDPDRHGEVAR